MRLSHASRRLGRVGIRLAPIMIYLALLAAFLWVGLPGLIEFSDGGPRQAQLIRFKEAVERQALVYVLHDLEVGRPVVCREYANQLARGLAAQGEGLDSGPDMVAFTKGLAAWRREFCAVPHSVVEHAIEAIRTQPAAALLGDSTLIGRHLWSLVGDPRREPAKAIEWAKATAVNLDGAVLSGAELQGASLRFCSLRGVQMVGTVIAEADLLGADVAGMLYSPENGSSDSLPAVSGIAGVENLETIRFIDPSPVYALRAAFKEEGYRDSERKLTFVIERAATSQLCSTDDRDLFQCLVRRLFMEWPTQYGLMPSRALQAILALIALFSLLYLIGLARSSTPHVWRVWTKDRISKHCGSDMPEPIRWNRYAPLWAIYFSIVSASQIGWKDFTIGNWIARIQAGEYTLQPTGWVRTVSGVQALLSVYLLAIWALTYFGRPFE